MFRTYLDRLQRKMVEVGMGDQSSYDHRTLLLHIVKSCF